MLAKLARRLHSLSMVHSQREARMQAPWLGCPGYSELGDMEQKSGRPEQVLSKLGVMSLRKCQARCSG